MFDNSSSPDRVKFLDGDERLRNVSDKLQKLDFPIKFPDISSIKIVLVGTASCDGQACKFEIEPLNSMRQNPHSEVAVAPK